MNEEIQVVEVEETTVQNQEAPKRDLKSVIIVGVIMAFAIVGFGLGYSFISKMLNGDTNANTSVYAQYLEKVSADEDLLELYLDQGSTSTEYLFSLYNPTEYAFSGNVDIFDEKSKYVGALEFEMVVPGMYGYAWLESTKEPYDYMINKAKFYKLNYEDVDFGYEFIYDYDDVNEWYSTLCGFDFKMDAVVTIAKRQYVWAALTGIETETYYFYDETVRYYEYEGYDYPSVDSALAYATIDTKNKTVQVYEFVSGEYVLVNTLEME